MSAARVSVVVPNLDGRHHLPDLLQSIRAQGDAADLEVIVVDNGSKDGSASLVRERFSEVRVIENRINTGFAAACNQGAEAATGRWLAFLNNDLRIGPGWVSAMVRCLVESAEDVVCAGSRILSWDGDRVDFERAAMSFAGGGMQPGFGQPASTSRGIDEPSEALFACAGAMMIDRAVFLEAGGFDEDYFAFFEDVDLGWRLWLLGQRVVLCPAATAYHRHHSTAARFQRHQLTMLRERNALFTIVKNYDDHSLAAVLPAALLLAVKRAAYSSGVPHEAFRPGDGGHSGRPPSTRVGIARRLNRSLVEVVHRLPGGDRLQSFRFVSALAYSRLVAIDELIEHLPQLMRKRHDVQSRRRRTDAEIAPLFGPEALDPADPADNYAPSHRAVLEELGVAAYFSRLLGDT